MTKTFFGFTRDRNSIAAKTNREPAKPKPIGIDPQTKRRHLNGQIAGITQELLNLPQLSDTDRRILAICSAVALLLGGR